MNPGYNGLRLEPAGEIEDRPMKVLIPITFVSTLTLFSGGFAQAQESAQKKVARVDLRYVLTHYEKARMYQHFQDMAETLYMKHMDKQLEALRKIDDLEYLIACTKTFRQSVAEHKRKMAAFVAEVRKEILADLEIVKKLLILDHGYDDVVFADVRATPPDEVVDQYSKKKITLERFAVNVLNEFYLRTQDII
ncbi:MAG: hypothetical protein ACYS47_15250 [Planctomycetota bacterium]|jgi:hypothetical protein